MHLFISFFVTNFVCKMWARPGLAKESLIPFIVQKMDFLPNRLSVTDDVGDTGNREYVYSAVVYQKYLTRLRELIIFEPWRENYHFSQPS